MVEHLIEPLLKWGARTNRGELKGMYPYRIDTDVGPLLLDVGKCGMWLYCRFTSVHLACNHFNPRRLLGSDLNPFSGKWNHPLGADPERAVELLNQAIAKVPILVHYDI